MDFWVPLCKKLYNYIKFLRIICNQIEYLMVNNVFFWKVDVFGEKLSMQMLDQQAKEAQVQAAEAEFNRLNRRLVIFRYDRLIGYMYTV